MNSQENKKSKKTMKCGYCKNTNTKIYHCVQNQKCFFQCAKCKLIMLDSRFWPSDLQGYYGVKYYKEDYEGKKQSLWVNLPRLRIMSRFFKKRGTVLEIGAGSGEMSYLLKEGGFSVWGVEPSKHAVLLARQHYGLNLSCGMFSKDMFGSSMFDYVCMYQLFEHIPTPKIFLEEVKDVLKQGGYLLIEIPNPRSIDAIVSKKLREVVLRYPQHLFLYPPHLLKKILESQGFEIVCIETSFSYFVASYFEGVKKLFKKSTKKINTQSAVNSHMLWEASLSQSKIKNIARKFFPGMQLTVIAKKL